MSESFRTAATPGWTILGNASLTSGGVDPAGAGWLRLTSATGAQAGSAIYDTSFASADGAQITFSYATYGGTGADGISFYLIDGATATPTVGAPGGGLGYSRINTPAPAPGVTNGYLGIGLDEYGMFATSAVGDCNPSCPAFASNMVTIRGSGSLNTGFNYLTRQGATIGTTDRAGAKRVRITVSPGPTVTVTVDLDSGAGFVNSISSFTVTGAPGQGALPATFKMGLSASTGGSTNYHEIRDLNLNGARPSTTALVSSLNPSGAGQSVTFTATITGAAGTPTGTATFSDGATVLGTSPLVAGVATLATSSLALGTHGITATYSGDGIYSASASSSLSQVVANTAPTASSMNPASGPLGGGTGVTIFGTNFVSGATVTFGGTSASVATVTPTQIQVTSPPGAAAAGVAVKVTNPDSQSVTLAQLFTYNPSGCWPESTSTNSMIGPCNPMVAGDPTNPSSTPISPYVSPDGMTYQLPPLWTGVTPDDRLVFFTGAPPVPRSDGRLSTTVRAAAPALPAPSAATGAYVQTTGSQILSIGVFEGTAPRGTAGGAASAAVSGYGMAVTGYSAGSPTFTTTVALASSKGDGVFDRVQKSGDFDLPLVTMDADGDGFADYVSAPWALIGTFLGGYIGGGGAPGPTPQVWLPLADTDGDGYGDAMVFDFAGTGQPSTVIPPMPALLPPADQRGLLAIPALGEWGLFALASSLAAAAWFALRRTVA